MNLANPSQAQLQILSDMEEWLRMHDDDRELINRAIFSVANRMNVHPHDVAIYILIRTNSI